MEKTNTVRRRGCRIYRIWKGVKGRCLCRTDSHFAQYGGSGVRIEREWIESFDSFRDWALSNGYAETLVLDRKESDGPYSRDNCRWITRKQNQQNARKWANSRSRFKGVSWNASLGKWQARIRSDGVSRYGGSFANEVEAAKKYDELAVRYFGEFARLNFPQSTSAAVS